MLTPLLILALLRPGEIRAPARVDPRVFAGKAVSERASFLVVLGAQADLSGAAPIADRIARRRYVFETLRALAAATQAPLRERLERAGTRFRSHFLVNMLEIEGDRALAEELAGRPEVSSIASNLGAAPTRPVSVHEQRLAARDGIEPNIEKVHAPELWSLGFTGQGIVIGSADTGFQWDHPALKSHYRGWDGGSATHDYNWHDAIHDAAPGNPCGSDAPAPCDDDSHGTATSGLAVGDDGAGNRIGVAPGARLIGCRNMDAGTGTPERYTECFEWFLAPTDSGGENPRPDLGADVINNSWTCPVSEGCTDPEILRIVIENVRAAGIAAVFAAGNNGASCSTIDEVPANYAAAITIGATTLNDTIAGFSSLGPVTFDGSNRLKPDLSAPGQDVRTAQLSGGYLASFSGTSAAAPHVAGAIALLWSAVPGLAGDVAATEGFLERGAVPLIDPVVCGGFSGLDIPNPVFGWGRLDIEGAFEAAASRMAPVLLPERSGTRALPPRP